MQLATSAAIRCPISAAATFIAIMATMIVIHQNMHCHCPRTSCMFVLMYISPRLSGQLFRLVCFGALPCPVLSDVPVPMCDFSSAARLAW